MRREKLVTVNEANLKEELARIKAERDELAAALKTLLIDVQDYPAWERPCYAVDVARAALAKLDKEEQQK